MQKVCSQPLIKKIFGVSELADGKSFLCTELKNVLLPSSLYIPQVHGLTPVVWQTTCWGSEFIHHNQFTPPTVFL